MIEPRLDDGACAVYLGDCLTVLPELPDASVDAVVTDPPYGLGFMGKEWDSPSAGDFPMRRFAAVNAGASRQGGRQRAGEDYARRQARDARSYQKWCEQWARELLRVLKPGGHLLAFGGTRTYHRLASGIEDAGFELRDSITWLYGSGFPKSLDVSKAIDKRRDDEPEVRRVCRWLRAAIERHPTETVKSIAERFGFHPRMVEHWAARDSDSQPTVPTWEQWAVLRDVLGDDELSIDQEVWRLNGRKGTPGEAWNERAITGAVQEWTDRTNYAITSSDGLRRDLPASADAQRWDGWGTALKPASEPIVVARKSLVGTVAANVLEHGTGALNINACRIAAEGRPLRIGHGEDTAGKATYGSNGPGGGSEAAGSTDLGRWPTNVVLDGVAADALDEQTGERKAGGSLSGAEPSRPFKDAYGEMNDHRVWESYGDTGGASRFFPVFRYEAKADQGERPRVGAVAHPTVKPIDLMRWLVRLVTPPGGLVLDPFLGSGTTAQACIAEGFRCIGIERDEDYMALIEARLSKPIQTGFALGEGVA